MMGLRKHSKKKKSTVPLSPLIPKLLGAPLNFKKSANTPYNPIIFIIQGVPFACKHRIIFTSTCEVMYYMKNKVYANSSRFTEELKANILQKLSIPYSLRDRKKYWKTQKTKHNTIMSECYDTRDRFAKDRYTKDRFKKD